MSTEMRRSTRSGWRHKQSRSYQMPGSPKISPVKWAQGSTPSQIPWRVLAPSCFRDLHVPFPESLCLAQISKLPHNRCWRDRAEHGLVDIDLLLLP